MFFKKSLFSLAKLSLEDTQGINKSAKAKGYPEVFIERSLNTDYRFVVHPDNVGTVWRWSGPFVDKVMFYYIPTNEKVWFFTDGRTS